MRPNMTPESVPGPSRARAISETLLGFLILAIVALGTAEPADADDYRPELTIQAPTAYVSGAPLPLSELAEYRLYCNGEPAPLARIAPTGPETAWQADYGQLPPGQHTCQATAVDMAGDESGLSNAVGFTVAPDAPAPPVLILVSGG